MFNEVKSWIIGNGLSLIWSILSPSVLKYFWNSFIGLRIVAVLAVVLGFVIIWQFKKIKSLQEKIELLTPPEKTTKELLEDEVLLLLDSTIVNNTNTNENYDYADRINSITGHFNKSIEILQSLIDKSLIEDEPFKIQEICHITSYYYISTSDKIFTLIGKDYVENLKKSHFVSK